MSLEQSWKQKHEAILEAVEKILEAAEEAHALLDAALSFRKIVRGYVFSAKGSISDILRISREILERGLKHEKEG